MKATNEALDAGIGATKPGNTADDVAQKFWRVLDKYGIKKSQEQDILLELATLPTGENRL